MRFVITLKTPDAVENAIEDIMDLDEREKARELCSKWFRWGECVSIGIDTKEGTATVIEAKQPP